MRIIIRTLAVTLLAAVASFPGLARAGVIIITQTDNNVSITGGDYEFSLSANGQNIDSNYGGSPLTVALGTPINFSGSLYDNGATTAGSQAIYVLPYAGANFAISNLSFSNTATNGNSYSVSGTYNSGEHISVPNGAETVVEGTYANFNTPFSSNGLNTPAAPEPSTWTLLGLGAIGAGWMAQRRRRVA